MADSPAHAAALKYLKLINAQAFDQVSSLFAEDAVFLSPTGETVNGSAAIGEVYANQFSQGGPVSVTAASSVSDACSCALEISPQLPGEDEARSGTVIDHFTVNEAGEITRLAVYMRPGPS